MAGVVPVCSAQSVCSAIRFLEVLGTVARYGAHASPIALSYVAGFNGYVVERR